MYAPVCLCHKCKGKVAPLSEVVGAARKHWPMIRLDYIVQRIQAWHPACVPDNDTLEGMDSTGKPFRYGLRTSYIIQPDGE